ncbi:NAD(P)/FAD-dependent oxidoreductase [Rhizobium grahamii]|uniref:FAD-dependent pyridine nucleotide-disulfide oxidoreductase n=1 Tax=Rhizobium grahamii CCGE 502 TaxID=990285 RepID=S3IEZ1_9HYPH|nr:FAD-dependent oxidoreductase [Rhizobium grahamii]EPE97593.1 FAD-dependent pyridine nucleotide-disulfide oxidoreductase [Rhizobium grahamii CCGE 502]
MEEFVIVGGGQCGARAALALRDQGFDGDITLIGEERHLPYERPPLSKEHLMSPEGIEPPFVVSSSVLAERKIATVTGDAAVGLDRQGRSVELASGRRVSYDKLLLATGSSPRKLASVEGMEHVFYLRTHDDAQRLSQRLVPGGHLAIIGAGFIGLELAAAARQRGLEVTVIEALPRILMRAVPEAIAARVHALHRAHGVRILCGTSARQIAAHDTGITLSLNDGEILDATTLVVGIGAEPRCELAHHAGLSVENGIAVNATLQTSDPAIYAAGDCCSFPYGDKRIRLEAWRNAQDQGAHASANMLGAERPYEIVPWFWSDQYDFSLQIAGLANESTSTITREIDEEALILFHLADDQRIVAASGWARGNRIARDIKVAEMLIAQRAKPAPNALSSSAVSLKSLLSRS